MIEWLRRAGKSRPSPPPERRAPPERRSLIVGGHELPVAIRTLRTARRMTLRIAPDGSEARITMPPWGRSGEALAFARERSDWLALQLAAVAPRAAPGVGDVLAYRGERLTIDWHAKAPRRPVLDDGAVLLGGPRESLERRLQRWLEAEALRLFAQDIADFSAAASVPPPRVMLSRARRRWGSCTSGGVVRLNWRLVMAPDFVRRSVVAHEIAHLVHFDHSPGFHAFLSAIYDGDLPAANRWLKREGRALYAAFG
jgi:predicted metal-dependent hydrolase